MQIFEYPAESSERLQKLTGAVGMAIWQIQLLEQAVAKYTVLVDSLSPGIGSEKASPLVDKALQATFGQTLGRLKRTNKLPADVHGRFVDFLEQRNWLVHHSRADCRQSLHSDQGTQHALSRIKNVQREAEFLLRATSELVDTHVRSMGVDLSGIADKVQTTLRHWHARL